MILGQLKIEELKTTHHGGLEAKQLLMGLHIFMFGAGHYHIFSNFPFEISNHIWPFGHCFGNILFFTRVQSR